MSARIFPEVTMVVDWKKDEYHHAVKGALTREILREKHEPLSQHQSQKTNP